ncbi:MAG TPA: hypothetical protein VJA19_15860 [Pseudomonas sp.]|nr:hypothetical protein [Pseudomonas sp.]
MSAPFDMALFLSGVLTGSHATRQRHLRQARAMQTAIQKNFDLNNPWNWQLKHVRWFLERHLQGQASATRYYYQLTARLMLRRLGRERDWQDRLRR